jgi:hypothetical protein
LCHTQDYSVLFCKACVSWVVVLYSFIGIMNEIFIWIFKVLLAIASASIQSDVFIWKARL